LESLKKVELPCQGGTFYLPRFWGSVAYKALVAHVSLI
jgi:hypothetical protein